MSSECDSEELSGSSWSKPPHVEAVMGFPLVSCWKGGGASG